MTDRGDYLESIEEIPGPHEFTAIVRLGGSEHSVAFEAHEHTHEKAHRDNNLRAAVLHVIADATVSVCVIIALFLALAFQWEWTDPVAGIVGALVIASWSFALIRDTAAILLDMNPDRKMADNLRETIEHDGDQLADLHLWRLGPGHLGAILLIGTQKQRGPDYYRAKLARFRSLSHLTIEVRIL
jgi:cation diffusion facilitator family transporter